MLPPIANNFVAGESAEAALAHAEALAERDVSCILNLLGEHYTERGPADEDAAAYCSLVRRIDRQGLDACVSVKPSQIGIDVGADVFRENIWDIVGCASEHDVFVWIDMEDHTTTDTTLDAYENLTRELTDDVGVCVQANLKRTGDDLARLADCPGKVRLVKGAYDEPPDVAYTDKARVDEVYRDHLEYMFDSFDCGIAVGSHDPAMIDYARELHETHGTDFEIQMLMGVREDAQRSLAADGYTVRQYAPYGDKWLSYFYRRVRERKENLLFALRAVVG